MVFLGIGGAWHRLYFDWGIIFWRVQDRAPEAFEVPEIGAAYRVVDLAAQHDLKGRRLVRYLMEPIAGGAQVTFEFEDGVRLAFRNVEDITTKAAAVTGPTLGTVRRR